MPSPFRPLWQDAWFAAAPALAMNAWRGVESQHDIATLKLVNTREEHDALEALLERSKPPVPAGGEPLHYLLSTPFRYASPEASRFRHGGDAGIWYGADSAQAACAEVAYWRHKFITQSTGLAAAGSELLTTHTLFAAPVRGRAINLMAEPWVAHADAWTHPLDYTATQQLAQAARPQGIEWIRYASARHAGAHCAAVLAVSALSHAPPRDFQEWQCRTTPQRVIFYNRAAGTTYSWDF